MAPPAAPRHTVAAYGNSQALRDKGVDLFLHQQGMDTSTTAGRAMFQMLGVFAEFERGIIRERVNSGLARARDKGTVLGRPRTAPAVEKRMRPPREGRWHAQDWSHVGNRHKRSAARRSGDVTAGTNRRMNRSCSADNAPQLTQAFELIALLAPILGYRRKRTACAACRRHYRRCSVQLVARAEWRADQCPGREFPSRAGTAPARSPPGYPPRAQGESSVSRLR
jgi:hypothetical protein